MQSHNAYFWKMLFLLCKTLPLPWAGRRDVCLYFGFAVFCCYLYSFSVSYRLQCLRYQSVGPTLCPSVGLCSRREGGGEMSAPGQYEIQPFRPLSSVVMLYSNRFLYVHKIVLLISFMLSLNCVLVHAV